MHCAEKNREIVNEACEGLTCEDGGINVNKMWKMKKLKCYDDTAARYKNQLGTWAANSTGRNWEMIGEDDYLTLRRDP